MVEKMGVSQDNIYDPTIAAAFLIRPERNEWYAANERVVIIAREIAAIQAAKGLPVAREAPACC